MDFENDDEHERQQEVRQVREDRLPDGGTQVLGEGAEVPLVFALTVSRSLYQTKPLKLSKEGLADAGQARQTGLDHDFQDHPTVASEAGKGSVTRRCCASFDHLCMSLPLELPPK